MAHVRTRQLTERELEDLLGLSHGEVTREGDYFLFESKQLGEGFPHYLRMPVRMELQSPTTICAPLTGVADISKNLHCVLGNQFDGCMLSSLFYRLIPGEKRDDLPVYEPIYDERSDPPTHLVVWVHWPLNCPPVEPSLDSNLAGLFKAVSCHRNPLNDGSQHGIDTWVFDLSAFDDDMLGPIWEDYRTAQLVVRQCWAAFELERPYYRRVIDEIRQGINRDDLSIGLGEDFATVILFEVDEEPRPGKERSIAASCKLWYDSNGLEGMRKLAQAHIIDEIAALIRVSERHHSGPHGVAIVSV